MRTMGQATRADFYGWQRVDFALQETAFQSGLVAETLNSKP
jgi:hypothetical protein